MSELHSEYYKKHYWNVHYKGLIKFKARIEGLLAKLARKTFG